MWRAYHGQALSNSSPVKSSGLTHSVNTCSSPYRESVMKRTRARFILVEKQTRHHPHVILQVRRSEKFSNFLEVLQLLMEQGRCMLTLGVWIASLTEETLELHFKGRVGLGRTEGGALSQGPEWKHTEQIWGMEVAAG